jgi:hypothetical protein
LTVFKECARLARVCFNSNIRLFLVNETIGSHEVALLYLLYNTSVV